MQPSGSLIRRWLILALLLVAVLLLSFWSNYRPREIRNSLAVGSSATEGEREIELLAPIELDGMSKAEILARRKTEVERYPELLDGPYRPSTAVFGQIEDALPWWGIQGQFFYGNGLYSIAGPSEEARFILNPFLLVAVEFEGLSIWGDRGSLWDFRRIPDSTLNSPDFPLYCKPEQLTWNAHQSRAEVTYDLTDYLVQLNRWSMPPKLTLADASFWLAAYNARDMGLDYIFPDLKRSTNLEQTSPPSSPLAIPYLLHRGNSCRYPGGCNNMSPYSAD